MNDESAETYLRQFAESLLRRVGDGKLTSDECSSRVHAVAAAFEGTGMLDAELADGVHRDVEVALAVRSPDPGTLMHLGRRAPFAARPGPSGMPPMTARSAAGPSGVRGGSHQGSFRGIGVTPTGAVLRVRAGGTGKDSASEDRASEDSASGDEDIYLLGFVSRPGRAWLAVAARTNERPARRFASPPSARNPGARRPAPSTFAGGGMTAVDDTGREYSLSFSGGGGKWYLGRLTLNPAPPAGISWLDVRCGTESARVDLTARAPTPAVTTLPVAGGHAEAYLVQRAETLLTSPALAAAEAAGMADVVKALRASGALADNSPVPGQVAALCERLGAPGRLIALPGRLPERWEGFLAATGTRARPAAGGSSDDTGAIGAARLAVTLPAGDGITVALSGLVTGVDGTTVIFGGLYLDQDPADTTAVSDLSMWLRDDAGGWHSASINGWSRDGTNGVGFQAVVFPSLAPATSRIDFYLTGPAEQIQAAIPLEWWSTP